MVRYLLYTLGVVLLLGLQDSNLQAQSTHDHSKCGVTREAGYIIKDRMLENRRNRANILAAAGMESGRNLDTARLYAPVQFHIVRRTDGTGGYTVNGALNALCKLNENFDTLNMQFYLAGPIRFINNSLLYDDGMAPAAEYFMRSYKRAGVINVFIVSITTGAGGFYRPGVQDDYICMPIGTMGDETALTHEFGHFFSLNHVFFGWEGQTYGTIGGVPGVLDNTTGRTPTFLPSGDEVENIARSGGTENCQIAADGFCDTEASYSFGSAGSNYNNTCVYAATAHDPYGYLFLPGVIAENPTTFSILEDEPWLNTMRLRNLSTKDKIYPKTKVVVETYYTHNGTTNMLWQDTIGDSDTTDIYCAKNTDDNIIGAGSLDVNYGFINLANHYIDAEISAPSAPSLAIIAGQSRYEITSATGDHDIFIDSIRVTNTSATITVPAATDINVTDIFYNGTVQISSETRTYQTPIPLAPGESYTFNVYNANITPNIILLKVDNAPTVAGVSFSVKTYAPKKDTALAPSDNYMSYYSYIGCVQNFTPEQASAVRLDYASRGYASLFPAPSDITLTDTVSLINPIGGASILDSVAVPNPLINFKWNAVPGATMYHVYIRQVSCSTPGVQLGEIHDFMVETNEFWKYLDPTKCYSWKVYPINANTICNQNIGSNNLGSPASFFHVNDWPVGVEKVQAEITSSKIYPNPTGKNQDILLEISSTVNGDANVTIYNSLGQEVMPAHTINLVIGDNTQKLSTASLNPGFYVVNIETAGGTISHKLVIADN